MAGKRKVRLTARTAGKYALYTDAVQSPAADAEFLRRLYEQLNGRLPVLVREDFCGTAAVSCQWVSMGPGNRAIGVDRHAEPLAWAREHYLRLFAPERRRRIQLRRADVLRVRTEPVDVILALNFSFCVFKQRNVLMRYLRRCRQAFRKGGILIMDVYGGPDAQKPGRTRIRKRGYTYVWEQARCDPIKHDVLNHIHFLFPDGSRKMQAFTYDWRLWTLPELTDALADSGFREARVYGEETNRRGQRTGIYRHRREVEPKDAWVAYVVGLR